MKITSRLFGASHQQFQRTPASTVPHTNLGFSGEAEARLDVLMERHGLPSRIELIREALRVFDHVSEEEIANEGEFHLRQQGGDILPHRFFREVSEDDQEVA
jgi:hypothetical protein